MNDREKARMYGALADSLDGKRESLLLGLIFRLGPMADKGIVSEQEFELLYAILTREIGGREA